jgi:predicted pyridoxine 5'-phosphate oxidase superfamily flavin-nucleotide-binding protein
MPITVDIAKAKAITKDRLRADRKPLLEEQDILFMKAQEAGTSTSAIVTEKQRLRDITNQVDSMTTTDELKAAKVTE